MGCAEIGKLILLTDPDTPDDFMNSSANSYLSCRALSRWPLAVPLLAIFLFSSSALALLMRDGDGPEPIIVQIKESLRLSDDLDASVEQLVHWQQAAKVTVEKWWAGGKLLELVSFPKDFTEEQALTVIKKLQESAAVEKVVAVSAYNLEFKPADFAREYAPDEAIPEAARRGLDAEEWSRPAIAHVSIEEAVRAPHVPNQIIVRWKSEYAWQADRTGFRQSITSFHNSAGGHIVQEMTPTPTDLIQVIAFGGPETSLADHLKQYADSPWVDFAQPNYIYSRYSVTPNDPYYTAPGQPNLLKIKAPEAWSITTGNHDVVVAVADTGANVNHPDFVHRVSPGWRNYVPYLSSDNVVDDDYGEWHGSNIASVIGAEGNNGGHMTGVAWDVSLLILKIDGAFALITTDNVLAATYYACGSEGHAPASVINFSFGSAAPSTFIDPALAGAVETARRKNMVVVAAAGNGDSTGHGFNCDDPDRLISPASIPTDNVIAVGATRVRPDLPLRDDTKTDSSNYGKYRVELGAPGGEDPDGGNPPANYVFGILGLTQYPIQTGISPPYNKLSGTSVSAPHVVGALALVKSSYPWEDYAGIRDRVIMGTDDVPALSNLFRTGGRLNVFKALQKRTLIRNFSTRAKVENGDRIIVGGFVIGTASAPNGTAIPDPALKVAIRGLGPSLAPLSVARLADPKLQLNDSSGRTIGSNDDWGTLTQSQKNDLAASGLTPADPREAAMVTVLAPGAYTVFLQSQDGQQGVGEFEIYELSGNTSERTRLRNVSARCPVGLGDEVAIAGTILGDSNSIPKRRLLIFGKSPFTVSGTLDNPRIELHGPNGALIDSNDDWAEFDGPSTGLEDKLYASGLAPQFTRESALWPTLAQGKYTTILQGLNNGIGLIEVFEY